MSSRPSLKPASSRSGARLFLHDFAFFFLGGAPEERVDTPATRPTPKVPTASPTVPESPQMPKTPQGSKTPKMPKTPQVSKTPQGPKAKKMPISSSTIEAVESSTTTVPPPTVAAIGPAYLLIDGWKDCLDQSVNEGVASLCLPNSKPAKCNLKSWIAMEQTFNGDKCPASDKQCKFLGTKVPMHRPRKVLCAWLSTNQRLEQL